MKRVYLYTVVLLLSALITLPVAQVSSAAASQVEIRHTIIAASGGAAPNGGTYTPFFFNATVNASHEVAFDDFLSGASATSGVFVGDGATTSTIALGGNPDPKSFATVFNPFITANGDVVFDVNDTDTFKSNGKAIVPLVRDGDPAPGGGTLSPLAGTRAMNDHGVISYDAFLSGTTATQAIFRTDGTETVAIARDDIAPPTGGTFTALFNPVMNDHGQVAFKSEMTGGSADNGIFRGEGGELTPVFVTNQKVPGGAIIQDVGTPAINSHGQVTALCLLTNSTSHIGLFVGDGTDVVPIAVEGQPAPRGGNYGTFFPGIARINDRGEVAFQAQFPGLKFGIFRHSDGGTATLAFTGMNAPGTTGTFASFAADIRLLNDGRVAFMARLTNGVGGVDSSNNMGIWVGTSEEDLQLVVRTGDVIGGNVLKSLPFQSGVISEQFGMNENGVLWIGSFQSAAKAIIFSRIVGRNED
ncbi:MAG TPA: choice-of-anchor tandem repeat NxxGxxAF-containing protein [Pyrinomonadaceae bacterium]